MEVGLVKGDDAQICQIILVFRFVYVSYLVIHAIQVSKMFYQVSPSQYIQSHTILKSISHNYVDKPALVLGGKRDVMKQVILGLV
jgi:hypothetical protein